MLIKAKWVTCLPLKNISAYVSLSEICEFISVVVRHIGIYFRNYGVDIHDPG